MGLMKLKPACKDYLWGGNRLKTEYGIACEGEILSEAWVLSCHPDGPSVIENGAYAGKTLREYLEAEGKAVLGKNGAKFTDFPILTKLIDARDNLSIQVHPDNAYAQKYENQYGKTEMWYIMDAAPDAFLYFGFEHEIGREEFERRIREDDLLPVLHQAPVHKGDVFFIEAGTLHAIGKNILLAEIQQNSNVTYRVYDYGRVGKDGKKRELHIEKALDVTNCRRAKEDTHCYPHVASCPYFTVDHLVLDGKTMKKICGEVGEDSFLSILFLSGEGEISCAQESFSYRKGESYFLPAGSGSFAIEGECDALITTLSA